MATMQAPKAYYGYLERSLIVALSGHVRYMAARALRTFLDDRLAREDSEWRQSGTVVVDLRELVAIDSTGMGLLAYLGRTSLQHGRRAVLVCGVHDVMTCLRSAAFDTLFTIVDTWPLDEEPVLTEVPLEGTDLVPDILGRVILDAHRDLASLSEANRTAFSGVISVLEADLARKGPGAN